MPPEPPLPNADAFKVSGDPVHIEEGWERFYPLSVRRVDDSWQVRVKWGRLVLTLVLFLILSWLSVVAAAYLFIKYQRGFSEARYTDMLLLFVPERREAFQIARGDFYVKNAQQEMAAGKYREAFFALQAGVGKSPANLEGRLLLAQFYAAWHRPTQAQELLLEGLAFHPENLRYLRECFTFLLQQQQDAVVIANARRLLATDQTINQRNQLLAYYCATAAFYRGNYDQAEDIIRTYQLLRSSEGSLLSIRIEWERGDHDGALSHLREMATQLAAIQPPQNTDEIYAQNIIWLRESGRESEARTVSLLRKLETPNNPRPRIDLLYAYRQEGNDTALRESIESLLHDFANDGNVLLAIADFAANSGDAVLARRIYELCKADRTNRLNWEYPALMVVEAQVVAKNYKAALETVRVLLAANPEWGKRFFAIFNGLQAIASYGLGDDQGGEIFLANFISQPAVRADNLVAVSNRLLAVGARAQARLVLAQAVKADPLNQAALTNLVKLDAELGNTDQLASNLRHLLTMRKPNPDILETAFRKLGSDLFLFYPERMSLLQEVRTALDAAKARTPRA